MPCLFILNREIIVIQQRERRIKTMLDRISLILVIIGALNWGSIGLFAEVRVRSSRVLSTHLSHSREYGASRSCSNRAKANTARLNFIPKTIRLCSLFNRKLSRIFVFTKTQLKIVFFSNSETWTGETRHGIIKTRSGRVDFMNSGGRKHELWKDDKTTETRT